MTKDYKTRRMDKTPPKYIASLITDQKKKKVQDHNNDSSVYSDESVSMTCPDTSTSGTGLLRMGVARDGVPGLLGRDPPPSANTFVARYSTISEIAALPPCFSIST